MENDEGEYLSTTFLPNTLCTDVQDKTMLWYEPSRKAY